MEGRNQRNKINQTEDEIKEIEGEKNSGFFHRSPKDKNVRKLIQTIKEQDNFLTDIQEISNSIVRYYSQQFTTQGATNEEGKEKIVFAKIENDNAKDLQHWGNQENCDEYGCQ